MIAGARDPGFGSARKRPPPICSNRESPIRHSRRATRARGFTLLEVIAAVLLLAITFASLMRVAGSSLTLTARSAERSEAAMWARSLLDSAFVLEPIRVGQSSGRFDEHYRWQLDVRPFQLPVTAQANGPQPRAPASPLKLYRLDLNVMWKSAGHDYSARFSTLRVGGPQPQGAGS
ncbi:prepilin-type N-terminal cleavage/methylation domain-containing protein [Frateuria sp. GZRR33]|uniref:type IV pilus modification PilV family protein n=1 Tax=Frateuria sp. GZRR33 TaxID=3351535 RepID=UPI003EDBD500